jgi:hypothetical protein
VSIRRDRRAERPQVRGGRLLRIAKHHAARRVVGEVLPAVWSRDTPLRCHVLDVLRIRRATCREAHRPGKDNDAASARSPMAIAHGVGWQGTWMFSPSSRETHSQKSEHLPNSRLARVEPIIGLKPSPELSRQTLEADGLHAITASESMSGKDA